MLKITIPKQELWDEANQIFINVEEKTLQLEHSLISVKKWESKWHKPFLGKGEKSVEETIDYIKCMTLTQNVDPFVYYGITNEIIDQVSAYIDDPMTATTIWDRGKNSGGLPKKEKITAEVLYCAMIERGIPFECQKWHLNQLIMLIRVFNERNKLEGKKRSSKEIGKEQAAINAARRKALHSKG